MYPTNTFVSHIVPALGVQREKCVMSAMHHRVQTKPRPLVHQHHALRQSEPGLAACRAAWHGMCMLRAGRDGTGLTTLQRRGQLAVVRRAGVLNSCSARVFLPPALAVTAASQPMHHPRTLLHACISHPRAQCRSLIHILCVPPGTPAPALAPCAAPPVLPACGCVPAPAALVRGRRAHKRVLDDDLLLEELEAVAAFDGAPGFVEGGEFDEDVALHVSALDSYAPARRDGVWERWEGNTFT